MSTEHESFNLTIVGERTPRVGWRCGWRDVALYAMSIGAGREVVADCVRDDIGYIPSSLGSYIVVPTLEPCRRLLMALGPGLEGLVHRSQHIRLHRRLAVHRELYTEAEVTFVVGGGDMAEVGIAAWVSDDTENLVAEVQTTVVYRNVRTAGAGQRPRLPKRPRPTQPADFRIVEPTARDQALLYATNGDANPIHLSNAAAQVAGFPGPILHGLCVFGFVSRAALRSEGAGAQLLSLGAEFRRAVFPGDTLVIDCWRSSGRELIMQVSTAERPGDTVLQHVCATFSPERLA